MKTSLKTRAIAFVAALFVTTTIIHTIASYALPEEPAVVLAQVTPGR